MDSELCRPAGIRLAALIAKPTTARSPSSAVMTDTGRRWWGVLVTTMDTTHATKGDAPVAMNALYSGGWHGGP